MGAPRGLDAARLEDHVRQGVAGQVLAHMTTDVGPHPEEHALALVITGAILVGLAEVARDDRTVNGGHDLSQRDRFGGPRQNVATTDAAL